MGERLFMSAGLPKENVEFFGSPVIFLSAREKEKVNI